MEDGTYTLEELSAGLGWSKGAIKNAIRLAHPNPMLHRDNQLYDVIRLKNGMFKVKYNPAR